jgi:hypothetical protein
VPQASGCGYHSLKKYLLVGLAKWNLCSVCLIEWFLITVKVIIFLLRHAQCPSETDCLIEVLGRPNARAVWLFVLFLVTDNASYRSCAIIINFFIKSFLHLWVDFSISNCLYLPILAFHLPSSSLLLSTSLLAWSIHRVRGLLQVCLPLVFISNCL